MSEQEFAEYLMSIIKRDYGGNQSVFARTHGISVCYVGDIIHRRKGPGPKILNAVGAVVRYEVTGIPKSA